MVLNELYVDLVTRGLAETTRDLVGVQRQFERATESASRYRRQIEETSRTTISGGRLQGGGGGVTGMREVAPNLQGQLTARTANATGGAGAAGMAAQLRGITVAAAGAMAAVAGLVAVVKQGFAGTTEMDMFAQTMTQISRELAALFAPALQLATTLIRDLLESFRGLGNAGQLLLGRISPIGMAMEVLANPAVQSALRQLTGAFGELLTAAQPLLNLLANVGTMFLKAFVIEPLTNFARGLTIVVTVLKEVVSLVAQSVSGFASLFGLQRLLAAPQGNRRTVTLNATGTEDAQGTFQRLQQAVLKAGQPPEEANDPQLKELQKIRVEISALVKAITLTLQKLGNDVGNMQMFPEGTDPVSMFRRPFDEVRKLLG